MKKSILLLAVVTAFSACKKDENSSGNSNEEEPIIATWTYSGKTTDKPAGAFVYHEKTPAMLSDFTSSCATSSTFKFDRGSNSTSGAVTIFDNCKKSNDNSTWILQNNVLTIGSTNFPVLQLDKSTLKVTFDGGDYGTIDPNTAVYTKQGNITDTFLFKH